MAGHSKWDNIKHKKAAADAKRGKVFTKHAKLIEVAARGGADPDSNAALRLAVATAKKDGCPADNIDRAIRKGAGLDKDAVAVEEITYGGMAPGGIPVIVECATDNRNRSNADVRTVFGKNGGQMSDFASVAWQFDRMGMIAIEPATDPDAQEMHAIEAGAMDFERHDGAAIVWTAPTDFAAVAGALETAGENLLESSLTYRPKNPVELDEAASEKLANFIEKLEDLDDVVAVSTGEK